MSITSHTTSESHTPGPWSVRYVGTHGYCIEAEGKHIATCLLYAKHGGKANASLVAAAPDLLAALQLVVDTYGFDPSIDSAIWQTAFAALKKAGHKKDEQHLTTGDQT